MDLGSLLGVTEVGSRLHDKNLMEELRELRKLRTAVMVEKCLSKNEVVICPKPRRQQTRQYGEHTDVKVEAELSDIIISKAPVCPYIFVWQASPPCYSQSPPTRASNPLVQDARFREQWGSQHPNHGVRIGGLDIVADRLQRTQSIPTMV